MNILTKICVVILLVTSLIACVVFVNMATVEANYKYYYEQGKQKAEQEKSKNLTQKIKNDEDKKALAAARTKFIDEKAALLIEKDDLSLRLKEAKQDITKLKLDLASLRGSLDELAISQKAQVKTIDALHADLKAANKDAQEKHTEAINFETLLKKSQGKAELLESKMNVLRDRAKRQNAAYIKVIEKLKVLERRHGVAGDSTPAEPLPPTERVTGTITAIKDNLASVNIGSNSGLKKGMKLIIYRGDNFVGRLKLVNVDVNEAAGILIEEGNRLAPMKGDKVTTKLE